MNIRGFYKTSLVDYPGHITSVIFIGGCNFRCGFCHNPGIALNDQAIEAVAEDSVLEHIEKKRHILDAVTVTGGEPTLDADLLRFCGRLKETGLKIKLDTNGSSPSVIRNLIENKCLDYVALDIKTSPEKYALLTGLPGVGEAITETVNFLKQSGIDFEIRSTCVPGIFNEEDIDLIRNWIGPVKNYYLQQFIPSVDLLNKQFSRKVPYTIEELNGFRQRVELFADHCRIRGI